MTKQPILYSRELVSAVVKHLYPYAVKDNGDYVIGSLKGESGKSMRICLTPPKAGLWFDFATGEGGQLTTLVSKRMEITPALAKEWLHSFISQNKLHATATIKETPAKTAFDAKQQENLKLIWEGLPSIKPRNAVTTPIDRYMMNRGIWEAYKAAILQGAPLKQGCEDEVPKHTEDTPLFARFDMPDDSFGLYQICITHNGVKATTGIAKKFLKAPCHLGGGAVKLFQSTHQLALSEGIETALAFYQLFEIPVWATCGSSLLANAHIPDSVSEVFIAIDNDEAGIQAGNRLAQRLVRKGRTVKILNPFKHCPPPKGIPLPKGYDWLDALQTKQVS